MKVGKTTRDKSMPGRTCLTKNHTIDLFSSENSSVFKKRNNAGKYLRKHEGKKIHIRYTWSLAVPNNSSCASATYLVMFVLLDPESAALLLLVFSTLEAEEAEPSDRFSP